MCGDGSNHDHDHGFTHDLPTLIGRRRALALFGGAGLSLCAVPSAAADCVLDAAETAGPYPADGTGRGGSSGINALTEAGILRQDIRTSFGGLAGTAEGTLFDLELHLVDARNGCAPLDGHAIYIWHCDALGQYSLYDLEDQNFLRGVGVTDAGGKVRFTTIFPGCYTSRWPHIHFEVFSSAARMTSGRDSLLISQLAFDESTCAGVYARNTAYANGTRNLARNSFSRDMVFADDTAEQPLQRTVAVSRSADDGLAGTVRIGI